jgi:hypothetical protein
LILRDSKKVFNIKKIELLKISSVIHSHKWKNICRRLHPMIPIYM